MYERVCDKFDYIDQLFFSQMEATSNTYKYLYTGDQIKYTFVLISYHSEPKNLKYITIWIRILYYED